MFTPIMRMLIGLLHICAKTKALAPVLGGRADNACTNLLGFFVRYVRTRGMVEIAESAKLSAFALLFAARTRHARLVRLTRARRGN